jgi:nitrate reductase gamma subunit
MVSSAGDALCKRCHVSGNSLGAADMVLPAKSLMCMPCHAATFSAGDTTTVVALIVFVLGFLSICSVWLSASLVNGEQADFGTKLINTLRGIWGVIFSNRIVLIIKVLILDGLLQRRLYRISISRWLIHALIFFPFLMRFCWGLIALVVSLWWPEWQGIWIVLDKNHPSTAFLYDLSGVLVILGVVLVIIRKYLQGYESKLEGLPKSDWLVFSLLGSIIIVGFILEGMRIAMTGIPEGAQYAFGGYLISQLFVGADLTGNYGYMWYVHTILTGVFVAYLPFSQMFHMIMVPVALAINATSGHSS